MIRWTLIGAVALIAWWGNGFSEAMAQSQGPTSATVLSIGDGDTIRVQQGGKRITIRLACIDAPEMAQPPVQWFDPVVLPADFGLYNRTAGMFGYFIGSDGSHWLRMGGARLALRLVEATP